MKLICYWLPGRNRYEFHDEDGHVHAKTEVKWNLPREKHEEAIEALRKKVENGH